MFQILTSAIKCYFEITPPPPLTHHKTFSITPLMYTEMYIQVPRQYVSETVDRLWYAKL